MMTGLQSAHNPSWNKMLLSAALWNFSFALVMLFASQWFYQLLLITPAPTQPVFVHLAAIVILAFGLGYLVAAGNPEKHRNIIALGMTGKLLVVLVVAVDVLTGVANWSLIIPVTGDLVYAVLFWQLLRQYNQGREDPRADS